MVVGVRQPGLAAYTSHDYKCNTDGSFKSKGEFVEPSIRTLEVGLETSDYPRTFWIASVTAL